MQTDNIIFKPKSYQFIIQEFEKAIKNGTDLPKEQFFIQHENRDIASTVVDLLSSPHSLSKNWEEKHQIFVTTEEAILKQSVVNSVNSLKMKQVEELLIANQDKMKTSNHDDLQELLQTQILLMEAQKQISAQLTRVIIK